MTTSSSASKAPVSPRATFTAVARCEFVDGQLRLTTTLIPSLLAIEITVTAPSKKENVDA